MYLMKILAKVDNLCVTLRFCTNFCSLATRMSRNFLLYVLGHEPHTHPLFTPNHCVVVSHDWSLSAVVCAFYRQHPFMVMFSVNLLSIIKSLIFGRGCVWNSRLLTMSGPPEHAYCYFFKSIKLDSTKIIDFMMSIILSIGTHV